MTGFGLNHPVGLPAAIHVPRAPDDRRESSANSIRVRAANDGANRVEGKPPRLEKAHLPGALLAGFGRDPELPAPDLAGALDLGQARGLDCLLGESLVEAFCAQ